MLQKRSTERTISIDVLHTFHSTIFIAIIGIFFHCNTLFAQSTGSSTEKVNIGNCDDISFKECIDRFEKTTKLNVVSNLPNTMQTINVQLPPAPPETVLSSIAIATGITSFAINFDAAAGSFTVQFFGLERNPTDAAPDGLRQLDQKGLDANSSDSSESEIDIGGQKVSLRELIAMHMKAELGPVLSNDSVVFSTGDRDVTFKELSEALQRVDSFKIDQEQTIFEVDGNGIKFSELLKHQSEANRSIIPPEQGTLLPGMGDVTFSQLQNAQKEADKAFEERGKSGVDTKK